VKLNRAKEIIEEFSQKKILVIGDIMLDQYLWGSANRISPEAPVPIVSVEKTTFTPGGAGNVALNLSGLGCKVEIAGLIGSDESGKTLSTIFKENKIGTTAIYSDPSGKTTVKTRVIAQDQQVVRIDQEKTENIDGSTENKFLSNIENIIPSVDGIILEDYNKGLFSENLIESILGMAAESNTKVYVDPKNDNFHSFKNVRLFKPNKIEFDQGIDKTSLNDNFENAGKVFRNENGIEILVVTRGAEGISVFTEGDTCNIPTRARKVHDVSGAGDTVISIFTLADLAGASAEEAAELANYGAGRVCEEVGVVPIDLAMLNCYLEEHHSNQ